MPEPEGELGSPPNRALNVTSTRQVNTPKDGSDSLNPGTGDPTAHNQYKRELIGSGVKIE